VGWCFHNFLPLEPRRIYLIRKKTLNEVNIELIFFRVHPVSIGYVEHWSNNTTRADGEQTENNALNPALRRSHRYSHGHTPVRQYKHTQLALSSRQLFIVVASNEQQIRQTMHTHMPSVFESEKRQLRGTKCKDTDTKGVGWVEEGWTRGLKRHRPTKFVAQWAECCMSTKAAKSPRKNSTKDIFRVPAGLYYTTAKGLVKSWIFQKHFDFPTLSIFYYETYNFFPYFFQVLKPFFTKICLIKYLKKLSVIL